jgi:glycosyltransferase involved in cell wall biosynthesis
VRNGFKRRYSSLQRLEEIITVLGINSSDLYSARFNGLSAIPALANLGINYELLTDIHLRPQGKSMTPWFLQPFQRLIVSIEKRSGFQSRFYFWSYGLRYRRQFRKSDVAHYHILHNGFFRIESLKHLSKLKPSVWTFHDLWIATGHCIQPMGCVRFGVGCGECPHLTRSIPVNRDRTAFEVERKIKLIRSLNMKFVVSTDWMKEQILRVLPISEKDLYVIPFGVNTKIFQPTSEFDRNVKREKFGIDKKSFIVFINAHNDEIKGIHIVDELVEKTIGNEVKFVLIDSEKRFLNKSNVYSFPRINVEEDLVNLIQISDMVVIPSLGESFSLLALESMSCGKTVITLRDSAPFEVVGRVEDYSFTRNNAVSDLMSLIDFGESNKKQLEIQGMINRERVEKLYTQEIHALKLATLYKESLSTFKNP